MPEMATRSKFGVEPGQTFNAINAPEGFHLAGGTRETSGPFDVVVLFSRDRAQLEQSAPDGLSALKPSGILWTAYPNPKSGKTTDLSRDHGWGALHSRGLVAVTPLTVDDDWSALRWMTNAEAVAAGHASAAVPAADMLPVGRNATLAYRLVRLVAVPALRLAFRFTVEGRENIPKTGTYVVIANHLGWLDAMTILMVFPVEPRLHMLADPTGMMRRKLEWALVRAAGGIVPVDRGVKDPTLLFKVVSRCLQLGGALALFPEGDFGPREGELLPFKKGFAHFSVASGVPVVPVGLVGPKDVWLGKRISVYIGEPIEAQGKTVEQMHQLGGDAVRRLLVPYSEPPGPKPLRRWLTGLF